ncbi:hypothetical protein GZ77_14870 [Endozoicomonas montiporae]|uniref:Uncharacterized protein n=2 Tax=Endozoicomonas montiporae TaxID=1027273 RepID=A0A081N575_9GAMM|nr:hypothetical protein [Endozoicomonas montiporae]AMO57521.1 hypothetical protein EZMO1_3538 [Endozoicomonas montiporae CL-33]KEQ13598.1 hypothetical protein GZ77_14870 [Endozoicomonas montiporae]
MLINAQNRFIKNQWFVINLVAAYLEVPATHVRITRLDNDPEQGLQIEGEYKKPRGRKWRAFNTLTRVHADFEQHQQKQQ